MKKIMLLCVAVGCACGEVFAERPGKWVRYVEATGSQLVDAGIAAQGTYTTIPVVRPDGYRILDE